jgi:hypothetical protein
VSSLLFSRAFVLFQKFTGDGAAKILKSLCDSTPQTFEDEILEFKAGTVQAQDLDAIWSKNLGAFANNEGGVLVWGVQAQRDVKTGIDAAHAVSLVPHVDVLKQKLLEKYQFLTDPVLAGTEVISVPIAKAKSEGFVVCFIPEGIQKPYRSLRAKQPYYIRIKDDSVEIPHTLLRQLFSPRYDVRLAVTVANATAPQYLYLSGNLKGILPAKFRRDFHLTVENTGDITAQDVYVLFDAKDCGFILWTPRSNRVEADLRLVNKTFSFCDVLHPRMKSGTINVIAVSSADVTEIPLQIKIFVKDAMPHVFKYTITKDGLIPVSE